MSIPVPQLGKYWWVCDQIYRAHVQRRNNVGWGRGAKLPPNTIQTPPKNIPYLFRYKPLIGYFKLIVLVSK